jgi:serine/threonine-protein kinase RIO1
MQVTLGSRLGEGGFGDVYEATDELGRQVAVKIIRGSGAQFSSALDHARALARARHPNVVEVYSIDTVADPDTGQPVQAVVMELLEGETLGQRRQRARFTRGEVETIGHGLINGLEHIHAQGLAHGDLHEDNVILLSNTAKIIDILYRDSLALLTTASRDQRIRRDILNLRNLLYDTLLSSELDPADAADFNAGLASDVAVTAIRAAFDVVIDPSRRDNRSLQLAHALQRIRDAGFVEGENYAKALAEETPNDITPALLEQLVAQAGLTFKHTAYLAILYGRLAETDKISLGRKLGATLDRETPAGNWFPAMVMMCAFKKAGWMRLPSTSRLRLEGVITNDILAGYYNIYGVTLGNPGTLGTYANTFWPYFDDRDRLVDNIASRLHTTWYGQNYVGKYLLGILPLIADTAPRRDRLVNGLVAAVANDAKLVIANLNRLPADWQAEIASRTGS